MAQSANVSDKPTWMVFIALIFLTAGTYVISFIGVIKESVEATAWAAMAISTAKAALVVLFFMHLKYEGRWKYTLLIPVAFLAVVLVMALYPDIYTRNQ
ncbi:MAG: cytochrome C oxidase subunit IV family protein [Planctomycetota bacterium]